MKIEKNTVVTVQYTLTSKTVENPVEAIVEKTTVEDPFVFLFGSGGLIEGFENNLANKKVGETFDFHLTAKEAYGEKKEDFLISVPIEAFKGENGEIDREVLKVGKVLPMADNQGNHLQGMIKEVKLDSVKMDFNHPMAGHDLHFVGEVTDIRSATEEEISHGHVHGPGGHHH